MTEPMPPDDRELEEFLARRSELSRRYREAQPPAAAPPGLDQAVLAQARQELQRARPPARRLRHWPQRFAAAAAVLLVAGLAWMVQQQPLVKHPAAESLPAPETAPLGAPPPPAAVASNNQPEAGIAVIPPAPPKALPKPRRKFRDAESQRAAAAPVVQEPAAAPPASIADTAQAPEGPAQSAAPAELAAGQSAKAAAAAAEPAPARQEEQSRAALVPPPPAPMPFPAPTPQPSSAPAPAAAAPMPGYPPPAAPAMPADSQPSPAPYQSAARANRAPPGNQACASPQRAEAQLRAWPEAHLDSADWLQLIRGLQHTDPVAARAELACFTAMRPHATVPDDLRVLLPASP
jgi:hypothetical protein